jgi:Flp pilus assembly protein TadD
MPVVSPKFLFAVAQHQSGALASAEAIYREVIAADPNHPDALHLLGLIASEAGRHETAAALIVKAIERSEYFLKNSLTVHGIMDV